MIGHVVCTDKEDTDSGSKINVMKYKSTTVNIFKYPLLLLL